MKTRITKLTHNPLRSLSLVASISSALLNVYCFARVLASWRSLKWDFDSEADALRVDAVKLVWGLLLLYFTAAATASTIGFVGIARVRHILFTGSASLGLSVVLTFSV